MRSSRCLTSCGQQAIDRGNPRLQAKPGSGPDAGAVRDGDAELVHPLL
ncbi:MAG TPA: hypothetical protein VKR21_18875 [Solirubrobacteraceae bacterium]|nr:hypothetical protein [Solirubrobacteraceae bacterium]